MAYAKIAQMVSLSFKYCGSSRLEQGCILAGISLSISSILLPTRKSGIRRDKYLSAAIFKEAVHSDDS